MRHLTNPRARSSPWSQLYCTLFSKRSAHWFLLPIIRQRLTSGAPFMYAHSGIDFRKLKPGVSYKSGYVLHDLWSQNPPNSITLLPWPSEKLTPLGQTHIQPTSGSFIRPMKLSILKEANRYKCTHPSLYGIDRTDLEASTSTDPALYLDICKIETNKLILCEPRVPDEYHFPIYSACNELDFNPKEESAIIAWNGIPHVSKRYHFP